MSRHVLVGAVLDVLGQRNGIQSLAPRFVHTHGGPHPPVGIDRVHVEVALQRRVSSQVGDMDFVSHLGLPRQGQACGQ